MHSYFFYDTQSKYFIHCKHLTKKNALHRKTSMKLGVLFWSESSDEIRWYCACAFNSWGV